MNRIKVPLFFVGTAIAMAIPSIASAQQQDCSQALVSSSVSWQYDRTLKLSMLNMIDNSNFEQSKVDFSGGITLPVDGVPINAFANFSDFEQARSREFQRSEFDFSEEESALYAAQFVPADAFDAYETCLRLNAQQNYGLHLIPREVSPDFVSIDLLWNSPPPVQDATLRFELFGGQATADLPDVLPPSNYSAVNFQRNEGQPLRLIVSANGFQPVRLTVPTADLPEAAALQPYEVTGYRPDLEISAHVQTIGDIAGGEGRWVGTRGRGLRLEGFSVSIDEEIPSLEIEYMCHVQGGGDTPWRNEGEFCGSRGEGRRLEGLAFRLQGNAAQFFDIEYRCHLQGSGDSQTYRNGQYCGSRGQSRRLEAFELSIVRK